MTTGNQIIDPADVLGDDIPQGDPTSTRQEQIIRNIAAYLSWHCGTYEMYGISQEYIDRQASAMRTDYHNRGIISDERLRSTTSTRAQMDEDADHDILTLDCETLALALHMPSELQTASTSIPDAVFGEGFSGPLPVGEWTVSWVNYADFRRSYQQLGHDVQHFPAMVKSLIQKIFPVFLPDSDVRWEIMLNAFSFHEPELRLTGSNRQRDVDELMRRWSVDDGKLVSVRGMVVQTGGMDVRPIRTSFKCRHCSVSTTILADPFDTERVKPTFCPNGDNEFGCGAGGQNSNNKASWILEPAPATVSITTERALLNPLTLDKSRPVELFIEMRGSLTGRLDYGMHIEVVGICSSIETSSRATKGIERKPLLIVTSIASTDRMTEVEVTDEEQALLQGWAGGLDLNALVDDLHGDFSPNIFGLDSAKSAIYLQSAGGNDACNDPDRDENEPLSLYRGREIHITFVGDPGLAKSQLMNGAIGLHPGSQLASGARCSVAGLIGTAAGNNSILGNSSVGIKPGIMALVSPGGILGIDELNNLAKGEKKATIEAMNEALEAGKVSSAMSFSGTVITKTPVMMVLNPVKGKSDENRFDLESSVPLITQIGIPGNTLSRQDLVLIFIDSASEEKDAHIANAIQRSRRRSERRPTSSNLPVSQGAKKWFAMCRRIGWVEVPQEIEALITQRYIEQRRRRPDTNPRWVATLRRLVEAAARLHGQCVAETQHLDFALTLLNESLLTRNPQLGEGGTGLSTDQNEWYEECLTQLRNYITEFADAGGRVECESAYRHIERTWNPDSLATDRPAPTYDEMMGVVRHYIRTGVLQGQPRNSPHTIWDMGRR